MGQEIWTSIIAEFADIPDLSTMTRVTLRLVLAAILGAMLGFEREIKARSAGVRTHMLVAVGAAIFVIGPLQAGMPVEDMSRVIQGVIQGIGFLGAGAIIVGSAPQKTQGLTTAANIWATAGIGVVVGLGLEATAVLSTVIMLIILAAVPYLVRSAKEKDAEAIGFLTVGSGIGRCLRPVAQNRVNALDRLIGDVDLVETQHHEILVQDHHRPHFGHQIGQDRASGFEKQLAAIIVGLGQFANLGVLSGANAIRPWYQKHRQGAETLAGSWFHGDLSAPALPPQDRLRSCGFRFAGCAQLLRCGLEAPCHIACLYKADPD